MTHRSMVVALAAIAAAAMSMGSAIAQTTPGNGKARSVAVNKAYIVQFADMPVAAYKGGVAGFKATAPRKGQKIDPNSPDVVAYMAYLQSRHDRALASVGGARKLYGYGYVFNGFAADLTPAQAAKLAQQPGVLAVTKDQTRSVDTASTPEFLGLTAEGGAWSKTKGEGVIIGVVDSGIWPESLSFSDRTGSNGNATKDGKLSYQQIPGWNGKCEPGEAFNASHCNQKLIGARFYNAGWGGNEGIDALLPNEFNSPRDQNGHGTHTASTAGGNQGVPATGPASVFGAVSGIAPRARIAAYKACWSVPGTAGSCQGVDLLAAIDQAVADGVDVINYSISGTRTNFRDPVEIAFLFAADAGVFVATSAGNSGPTVSTVAHPSPWVTTVAAGTHNRDGAGSTTLGNGVTYNGASVATATGPAPLIAASAAGLPGADPAQLALCFGEADGAATLDPAKVRGKIVVCDRGVTARVSKSLAVQQAGGVGMILVNTGVSSLNADFHYVPTVHLQSTSRSAVLAYAAGAGATASIAQATIVYNTPAPFTASFSSRGPLLAGGGDILKPDVIAPGQDILAAVSPPGAGGRDFDLLSGTSMSSPHVAGLAALIKSARPGWSPMMIKSAMMTTAYDVLDGPNTNPLVIFRQGAGHVRPNSALDPGLVYDSGFGDWLSFLCAAQPGGGCTGVTPTDPSDLNQASIAIGDLAGVQTVKRRVTNVSGKTLTMNAVVTGLTGISTTVSPASITLAPGKSAEFTVTFTRADAALNAYVGGYLTWTGGGYNVRSPVVVRPVSLGAPASISAGAGGASFPVSFGYSGPFTAAARGLVPAVVTPGTVTQDPDQTFDVNDASGTVAIAVTIPEGSTYVRFALFDADVSPGTDIDMFVYQGSTLVGSSTNGASAEEVNLSLSTPSGSPIALTVYVHGWGVAGGTTPFKLHQWTIGSAAAGNMAVSAPTSATLGQNGTVTLSFSGLASGTRYLGSVAYSGSSNMPSPTIVRVDGP